MDVMDCKPNSHAYKEQQRKKAEEKPKMEKIIRGGASVKQKSPGRKFADVFISEDVSNVKGYIIRDVIVPAAKKLVSDIVQDGIEMLLYGSSRRGERRSGFRADSISYNNYYKRDDRRRAESHRGTPSYDNIQFDYRDDAEAVLDRMTECIEAYGQVTVGDLYDTVGITGSHTDERYGWVKLGTARVVRDRDKFVLDLPKPLPLER